jgi:hypothetical protein
LEQNAGKPCTPKEAAAFLGIKASGPFNVEVASASKYGFLERPSKGKIQPSELAKKIIRPQDARDELQGYRDAVLATPIVSDVYNHYRGENLPDEKFFANALTDKFGVSANDTAEFHEIFLDALARAQLIAKHADKARVIDITSEQTAGAPSGAASPTLEKLTKAVKVSSTDSCFVMMPFADPQGAYYEKVYAPAIEKAGLKPVRADANIFGTGKIMDQIWVGINAAKVSRQNNLTSLVHCGLRVHAGPCSRGTGRAEVSVAGIDDGRANAATVGRVGSTGVRMGWRECGERGHWNVAEYDSARDCRAAGESHPSR